MKLYKLIKYDLTNGIFYRFLAYAGVALLGIIFCMEFHFRISQIPAAFGPAGAETTGMNYLMYLFEGKAPFTVDMISSFIFPVVWMILILYIAYLTLEYPMRNMTGHGVQVIIRTKNRTAWWISKCVWTVVSVLVAFCLLIMSIVIVCFILGNKSSLITFSAQVNEVMMGMQFSKSLSVYELWMTVFALPALTLISIGLIQLCLSLFFKRIYCFMAVSILLLASTYYQSPATIGNFAMVQRSGFANPEGVSILLGLCINTAVMICAVSIGIWKIRRHDILEKA